MLSQTGSQVSYCTSKNRAEKEEREEKKGEAFFKLFFSLFLFLVVRALKALPMLPISIVHGAPGPEPRSPLSRALTGVAGHAPAPAAGRTFLAAVLERAEALGADCERTTAATELAAAGPRAAAAVAWGGRGLSLFGFFDEEGESERVRKREKLERRRGLEGKKKNAPPPLSLSLESQHQITFALTAHASSSRFCSCLARSGSMYCASSAETAESSSSSPSNERALLLF